MGHIQSIVERLKTEWSSPRTATHEGYAVPVPLVCSFRPPVSEGELNAVAVEVAVPPSLIEFWRTSNGAALFEDTHYGQWGLHLFAAPEALAATARFAAERKTDHKRGDLVLGEFLGDSDLLIIRCDPALDSYGSIVIALPIDERADWDMAAPDLETFLAEYADTYGEKFWRRGATVRSS
jgi:hypothetical protein